MAIKIVTFGCRLNTYESEVIKTFLTENEKIKNKNIIIFNSCTVTSEAEKQLRQAIRKAKKENPNSIIGVIGCAVQTNGKIYENMPEVDFVLGNIDKMKKNNYKYLISKIENIDKKISNNFQNENDLDIEKPTLITNIFELQELSPQLITGFEEKTRGFIQIQTGCDNHCTFCATRLARGKSVSIPSNRIIEQINILVENGYNEIVLTGIDITDYGKRLNENINLGKLMKKILAETDLLRLRLSSLDVADLNNDLKDVLFNEKRVMPHIHISLQSGDDSILKKMARRHNRQNVIDFCDEIRKYRPNIAIGADLIAGFPTETEAMHKNSYDLVKEINLTFGHIFPYSIRENTAAVLMKQVPMEIRRRRAKELRELSQLQLNNFIKTQINKTHSILIENEKIGRTENYLTINLPKDILNKHKIGDVIDLKF